MQVCVPRLLVALVFATPLSAAGERAVYTPRAVSLFRKRTVLHVRRELGCTRVLERPGADYAVRTRSRVHGRTDGERFRQAGRIATPYTERPGRAVRRAGWTRMRSVRPD